MCVKVQMQGISLRKMRSFSAPWINRTFDSKKVFAPQNKRINDASVASLVDDRDGKMLQQLLEQTLKRVFTLNSVKVFT